MEFYKDAKDKITELVCHSVVNSSIAFDDAWNMPIADLNTLNKQIKERIELEVKLAGGKM